MTAKRDRFIMLFIMLSISGKLVINSINEIVFTYQDWHNDAGNIRRIHVF